MPGKVIMVPTPVGNLGDITLRAIDTLKEVDSILAEDTRVTGKLLQHLGIKKNMYAYHLANEHRVLDTVLEKLKEGLTMALVTDCGTPGISDPGFLLIRACLENDIAIETLPGATAFVPALVNSGLPCDKFYFEGFLPHKKGRQTRIEFILNMPCTVVFYESPHRLQKALAQIAEQAPDRKICVSREISKKFEEHIRGTVAEVKDIFEEKPIKGEFVLTIEGKK